MKQTGNNSNLARERLKKADADKRNPTTKVKSIWTRAVEEITQMKGLLWAVLRHKSQSKLSSSLTVGSQYHSQERLGKNFQKSTDPSPGELLKYLAKDLETDPPTTESQALEMTVDLSSAGLN